MSDALYYIISGVLTLGVLAGIAMMSKVKSSVKGNLLSALCMVLAIILTLYKSGVLEAADLWICMAVSACVSLWGAYKIKMIEMPQTVALLNGFGGAASAIVALMSVLDSFESMDTFSRLTAGLAIAVGTLVLTGSLVAGAKLHKLLPQRPVIWSSPKFHQSLTILLAAVSLAISVFLPFAGGAAAVTALICLVVSGFFGYAFSIRVGGADMPITISLLNSLSGVAGSIAGMAISDPLLVAVGGIVGASGLLLTQIMCKAMNRSLWDILLGKTQVIKPKTAEVQTVPEPKSGPQKEEQAPSDILSKSKSVIIIPGYGMALAQAQSLVKRLADKLEAGGADVKFAIHPVAGRMPGHMNVLLAEADVPYEKLYEMDDINGQFASCDTALVVGANDVINPAANTAEGTPIYGMPVLSVADAKNVIICNYDRKPGYAGVDNPLYTDGRSILLLGDAKESLEKLIDGLSSPSAKTISKEETTPSDILSKSKAVIIIPGYGMALAQAQSLVKRLADKLEAGGADVKFAIHPVAGRMPGHMNVLLAEADVPYEKLYEMDDINGQFASCDTALVVGANDVINPAANTAEGTPIYGMPVLSVADAKNVIICNYDRKPGYAGVDNPLYTDGRSILLLGDAKESLEKLIDGLSSPSAKTLVKEEKAPSDILSKSKAVIIIPGYGMALAQAQSLVKRLADKLEAGGADVKFAIHPVAGRMPGHMNVLLAEADVPYEKLYEMDDINGQFASCDTALVVGANDVINPAANTAEGTPIYGMPVLSVADAKNVIICNYDRKPGYAGVDNPLYTDGKSVLLLGDAKESLEKLIDGLSSPSAKTLVKEEKSPSDILSKSKAVIIIPGYGMALAQAQSLVKRLADKLEAGGADVKFAIHPVAGRMPGHMNVLLAEADVPYEKLYEMDDINGQFASCDTALVVGANDVINPAANTAEGTPIYGMPVLSVADAKNVIICNYDRKPGYAGVDNPLYTDGRSILLLGDAKESLEKLIDGL